MNSLVLVYLWIGLILVAIIGLVLASGYPMPPKVRRASPIYTASVVMFLVLLFWPFIILGGIMRKR